MAILTIALLALHALRRAAACSYVEVPFPGRDGSQAYLIARTMELGDVANLVSHRVVVVPRTPGRRDIRRGRYGYVAAVAVFQLQASDKMHSITSEGMNEHGLSVSALALLTSKMPKGKGSKDKDSFQWIVGRLLSSFKTAEGATGYFSSVNVSDSANSLMLKLHWAIADAAGRSFVVEYLDGSLHVLSNPPRVLTNDPELRWHWRHLDQFVHLSVGHVPKPRVAVKFGWMDVPRVVGAGWNLRGLPGDFSSASRFVRLFFLRQHAVLAEPPQTLDDAIVLATGLLNNVFVPRGLVPNAPEAVPNVSDYTSWAILKSPQALKFMFRGYRKQRWRLIDLARIDFSRSASWDIEDADDLGIEDVTSKPTSLSWRSG